LSGASFPIYGDSLQSRDFTYVEETVDATVRAATAPEPPPILNIGGHEAATLLEIADLVAELSGRRIKLDRRPAQNGDVRRTGADPTLARASPGWRAETPLRDGLAATVDWAIGLEPARIASLVA